MSHHTPDTTIQQLGEARMQMAAAVTRSAAGAVCSTMEHLAAAGDGLEAAGRDEVAAVVRDIRAGDCTCHEARYELRQLMQLLDADVEQHIARATPFDCDGEEPDDADAEADGDRPGGSA